MCGVACGSSSRGGGGLGGVCVLSYSCAYCMRSEWCVRVWRDCVPVLFCLPIGYTRRCCCSLDSCVCQTCFFLLVPYRSWHRAAAVNTILSLSLLLGFVSKAAPTRPVVRRNLCRFGVRLVGCHHVCEGRGGKRQRALAWESVSRLDAAYLVLIFFLSVFFPNLCFTVL